MSTSGHLQIEAVKDPLMVWTIQHNNGASCDLPTWQKDCIILTASSDHSGTLFVFEYLPPEMSSSSPSLCHERFWVRHVLSGRYVGRALRGDGCRWRREVVLTSPNPKDAVVFSHERHIFLTTGEDGVRYSVVSSGSAELLVFQRTEYADGNFIEAMFMRRYVKKEIGRQRKDGVCIFGAEQPPVCCWEVLSSGAVVLSPQGHGDLSARSKSENQIWEVIHSSTQNTFKLRHLPTGLFVSQTAAVHNAELLLGTTPLVLEMTDCGKLYTMNVTTGLYLYIEAVMLGQFPQLLLVSPERTPRAGGAISSRWCVPRGPSEPEKTPEKLIPLSEYFGEAMSPSRLQVGNLYAMVTPEKVYCWDIFRLCPVALEGSSAYTIIANSSTSINEPPNSVAVACYLGYGTRRTCARIILTTEDFPTYKKDKRLVRVDPTSLSRSSNFRQWYAERYGEEALQPRPCEHWNANERYFYGIAYTSHDISERSCVGSEAMLEFPETLLEPEVCPRLSTLRQSQCGVRARYFIPKYTCFAYNGPADRSTRTGMYSFSLETDNEKSPEGQYRPWHVEGANITRMINYHAGYKRKDGSPYKPNVQFVEAKFCSSSKKDYSILLFVAIEDIPPTELVLATSYSPTYDAYLERQSYYDGRYLSANEATREGLPTLSLDLWVTGDDADDDPFLVARRQSNKSVSFYIIRERVDVGDSEAIVQRVLPKGGNPSVLVPQQNVPTISIPIRDLIYLAYGWDYETVTGPFDKQIGGRLIDHWKLLVPVEEIRKI